MFDEVASLSVEGLNKSAIARVKRVAWNTVHRWLERAAAWCRRFSDRKMRRLAAGELQADEIRTIVGGKQQSVWVFVVIDVWPRLWPSTIVGQRSYRNTLDLFRDLSKRMSLEAIPLITTEWIQVLRESHRTSVWASVLLWSGDQDPQERSNNQGRAKSRDRSGTAEASSPGFGGFSSTEHLIC
jgi:hypothetical protein